MALSTASLTLADGTLLENSSCGGADNSLWCWITGKSMEECFTLFNNPNKTNEITVRYNTMGIRYKGYTEMQVIRRGKDVFDNDTVDVRMTYPEGAEHSIEEFEIPKEPQKLLEE